MKKGEGRRCKHKEGCKVLERRLHGGYFDWWGGMLRWEWIDEFGGVRDMK